MKKGLVVISLYLALGSEASAYHRHPFHLGPSRSYGGLRNIYYQSQYYQPGCMVPPGYNVYQSYYVPYYQSGAYLTQQARSIPLGWNRYYLAAKLQPPYSLIIRNSLPYSSYREAEEPPPSPEPGKPPVTLHTVPPRELTRPSTPSAPPASASRQSGSSEIEISRGMTEAQVRAQIGSPMMQVVLGDTRTYVYDRFTIEFEKGRVKNVTFK